MASSLNIVIFGLTVSSSWGNGHATLWRGLLRALDERGHTVTFYEKDVPYYAGARDLHELPGGGQLKLYSDLKDIGQAARRELDEADLAICTSYCPSGAEVATMILNSKASIKAFYDLDTPVTMDALQSGKPLEYIPADGLAGFDLVLSYTGGRALDQLQSRLGAKRVVPFYGWVDPFAHYPVAAQEQFRADLSYLGTYAEDRQQGVQTLFIDPARKMQESRFLLGGAQYPDSFPWTQNIYFQRHMPPAMHPVFFCSSQWTLNVTRRAMAENGYCPSGRLFEAAACGTPLISDVWEGLDEFFTPGEQIVLARSTEDVIAALSMTEAERLYIAAAARERTLAQHTAAARVLELEALCNSVLSGPSAMTQAGSLVEVA